MVAANVIQDPHVTLRRGLLLAVLYSYVIPVVCFLPFLVARVFGIPLAQNVGLTPQNIYIFLIIANVVATATLFVLIRKMMREKQLSWKNLGVTQAPLKGSVAFIVLWPFIIIAAAIVIATITSLLGISPDQTGGSRHQVVSFGLIGSLIVGSIIAPVVEEVIFRGMIFGSLFKRYGFPIALVLSSLVFSLMHINPAQIITTLILGPYLCFMYRRLGSIVPGMVLHALHNASITVFIFTSL